MAALSFKGRFAELIVEGKKTQTIRNFRKHPIKVGERLYLYYAMRTKFCKKLKEAICGSVDKITIRKKSILIHHPEKSKRLKITEKEKLDRFAVADGFKDFEEMQRWWTLTHGPKCFPFTGQLISWVSDNNKGAYPGDGGSMMGHSF
jgi:hypothetical protein